MQAPIRIPVYLLLAVVLHGCGTSAHAPIDSRSNGSQRSDSNARTETRPATTKHAAKPAGDYHVVQPGDTLYAIAWQYGLNYRELARINDIRAPYTIYRGQRLRIQPTAGKTAAKPAAAPARPAPAATSAPTTAVASAPKPAPKPTPTAATQASAQPVSASPATPGTSPGRAVPAYDGTWVWPTRGRVLTRFQSGGTGKKGIDIGGHEDQPVKAAANGKVVYAGSGLVGYGRLIIVKHNENLLSAYGHNNKLLVQEGEHVAAGQMIAKMGSSGTNRNELYFEIRKNGKPTDPLKYLPKQ